MNDKITCFKLNWYDCGLCCAEDAVQEEITVYRNNSYMVFKELNGYGVKKVFPVLQIHYQEKGEEKPIVLPGIGEVLKTIITAEYLLYLFKSEDEYYYLSLRYDERSGEVEIETDGKALGKYNDNLLKGLSHGIPMVGIAYGNPKYSIDFADVDIAELFFQPLNTQDKYSMDYSSQFHKEGCVGNNTPFLHLYHHWRSF